MTSRSAMLAGTPGAGERPGATAVGRWLRSVRQNYLPLIKSHQTGLLVLTGIGGYTSAGCRAMDWSSLLGLAAALVLSVSGSTLLNMVWDRDIDAKMARTCHRPLAAGRISATKVLLAGVFLSLAGVAIAFALSPLCGWLVGAGVFFDAIVYTVWLKRRSAWSILWGGIAGTMPILAGRALATGVVDLSGALLALAVLLWIPTHIITFSIRHMKDYAAAGVPTLPAVYGVRATRLIIVASCAGAALAILAAVVRLGMSQGLLALLAFFSVGVLGLTLVNLLRPSAELNFTLFKAASIHMLSSMLLLTLQAWL